MKLLLPGIASLSLVSAIPASAAEQALGRGDVAPLVQKLWAAHVETLKVERADEVIAGEVRVEGTAMRYLARVFGERPKDGRSLFISMHGGGGTTASANDQQWANQIRLYQPAEGIYIAPRAPGNSWNLWHTAKIDPLFDRLIETMVVIGGVNPDKVYLMGYSAGGDGVYQLAPRMSDRFAAAAMMAGHPNETSPLGLRNIPFALQVGALDAAYDRNKIAGQWGEKLAGLREEDPGGYENFVRVREGKPHWMDLEDKEAVPWMAKFERRRFPGRVVWKQDDVTHSQFYWLALPEGQVKARQLIVAKRDGQTVTIEKAEDVGEVTILLNDEMVDLDQRVKVVGPEGDVLFEGLLDRSRTVIERTLKQRGDRLMVFSAEVTVEVGAAKAEPE
jgi:pimeloyl-ACP methyl ester carboxylesterase